MDYTEIATRAEMKEEALRRMEALWMDETMILNFREKDRLIIMDNWVPQGFCFGVADDELLELFPSTSFS